MSPRDGITAPVLTVTPNTALDRCLLVPEFQLGRTVVAQESVLAMAGKAADCSLVLAELGVPSTATGLMGGENGATMVAMLEAAGVECRFLACPGETRLNVVIITAGTGLQGTVTVPSLQACHEDGEALVEHVRRLLPGRQWLVLGGSLPEGVDPQLYTRMIRMAQEAGVRVLLDAGGPTLMKASAAGSIVAKPNHLELGAALGRKVQTVTEAATGARDLMAMHDLEAVIVTIGASGAVAATPEGTWRVPRISVDAINTAGAGDAFGAGLIKALLDSLGWDEALRWAVATAAASVLTLGTAEVHRGDVERLLSRATVEPLEQTGG